MEKAGVLLGVWLFGVGVGVLLGCGLGFWYLRRRAGDVVQRSLREAGVLKPDRMSAREQKRREAQDG